MAKRGTKCRHETYKEIDDSKWCMEDQELNNVKCQKCRKVFVHTNPIGKQIKPSKKQVVHACFNVNDCNHAYCHKCWGDKLQLSKGRSSRSRR